jgi:hypothetical protein
MNICHLLKEEVILKAFLPPCPDQKVVTPLLKKGGEIFDTKYLNFLLLNKEEYPDRSVGGRWWLLRHPLPRYCQLLK